MIVENSEKATNVNEILEVVQSFYDKYMVTVVAIFGNRKKHMNKTLAKLIVCFHRVIQPLVQISVEALLTKT